ncbi:fibronectin type III domain-containing protein [Candidatus Dojkabacteria bacterium]|nr:fibronectin type III domain-containing protein [Candidatus Dojkabacteria bacterium]
MNLVHTKFNVNKFDFVSSIAGLFVLIFANLLIFDVPMVSAQCTYCDTAATCTADCCGGCDGCDGGGRGTATCDSHCCGTSCNCPGDIDCGNPCGGGGCGCSNPGAVSLLAPADNSTKQPSSVALDWSDSDFACTKPGNHYEVRVREGSTGGFVERADCTNPTSSSCTITGLLSCTTYKWRVQAVNACGSSTVSSTFTFTTNCNPEIISITPNIGQSGTIADEVPVSTCDDHNPQTYTVTVRDQDSADNTCNDLDYFAFWFSDGNPHVTQLADSSHGMIKNNSGTWKMLGLRCNPGYGATCSDGSTACDCYQNFFWDVGNFNVGAYDAICSPPESMSNPGSRQDYTNYENCMTSSTYWMSQSNVLCSGKDAIFTITVAYDQGFPSREDLFLLARDIQGGQSSPGWADHGDWTLDFDAPIVSVSHAYDPAYPPDTLRFTANMSDNGVSDTGIRSITGLKYTVGRIVGGMIGYVSLEWPLGNGNYNFSPAQPIFTLSEVRPDASQPSYYAFEGGDDVGASATVMDNVCNVNNYSVSGSVADNWMLTEGGDVFANTGFSIQIPVAGENFSNYWVSKGGGSFDFGSEGIYAASDKNWIGWMNSGYNSGNYNDQNKNLMWYSELYTLALGSDYAMHNYTSGQSGMLLNALANGEDGIYYYTGNVFSFPQDFQYDGKKLLFLNCPTVNIDPDLTRNDDESALAIITNGNVIVGRGGYAPDPDNQDVVQAAIITDARFESIIDKDDVSRYDQLLINGLVFAREASFRRDLIFADNQSTPSELIVYDARYLLMMRDMLGEKKFQDFECGIVEGSDACLDW